MTKIKKMTDEECITKFLEFISSGRVVLDTGFISDEETGTITHQIIQVKCGDFVSVSQPERLAVPLRPANGAELGIVVN